MDWSRLRDTNRDYTTAVTYHLKRQLDIGATNGAIAPWLVPGLSGLDSVEINPRIVAWSAMRRVLPGNPERCRPAEHFPLLLRHIRVQAGSH